MVSWEHSSGWPSCRNTVSRQASVPAVPALGSHLPTPRRSRATNAAPLVLPMTRTQARQARGQVPGSRKHLTQAGTGTISRPKAQGTMATAQTRALRPRRIPATMPTTAATAAAIAHQQVNQETRHLRIPISQTLSRLQNRLRRHPTILKALRSHHLRNRTSRHQQTPRQQILRRQKSPPSHHRRQRSRVPRNRHHQTPGRRRNLNQHRMAPRAHPPPRTEPTAPNNHRFF